MGWLCPSRRTALACRPSRRRRSHSPTPQKSSTDAVAFAESSGRRRYASELGDTKAKATALKPLKLPKRDGVYLFGHVGSWGFAPEPKVWEAFLDWMAEREDDFDADAHFSVGADGEPWSARRPGYRESVVSRWYRGRAEGKTWGRLGSRRTPRPLTRIIRGAEPRGGPVATRPRPLTWIVRGR